MTCTLMRFLHDLLSNLVCVIMCHPPKNGNSSEFRGNQRILVQSEGVAVLNFLGILKLKLLSETMGIAREE